VVTCLKQSVNYLPMVQLMPLPPLPSLASIKSRIILPFWYRLTQVVLDRKAIKWVLLGWFIKWV